MNAAATLLRDTLNKCALALVKNLDRRKYMFLGLTLDTKKIQYIINSEQCDYINFRCRAARSHI